VGKGGRERGEKDGRGKIDVKGHRQITATASPPDGVHDLRLPHHFEAAEGADFPKLSPYHVGVAGAWPN